CLPRRQAPCERNSLVEEVGQDGAQRRILERCAAVPRGSASRELPDCRRRLLAFSLFGPVLNRIIGGDIVGSPGPALTEGLRRAGRAVLCGLVLDLAVELRADDEAIG